MDVSVVLYKAQPCLAWELEDGTDLTDQEGWNENFSIKALSTV